MVGERLYRIDEDGFPTIGMTAYFDEDGNLLSEVKDGIIKHVITQGLIKPRWDGAEWVEDMPQEEIDELYRPQTKEPSEIDLLGQEVVSLKLANMQKDSTINMLSQELVNIKLQLLQGGM